MTQRLVVISPHLDDAVLGCSALFASHDEYGESPGIEAIVPALDSALTALTA